MRKICLCYFSGTGMTKYIVDKLTDEFEKHHISADCIKIEAGHLRDVVLSGYDALGIAYPVHSFNAPQIVIDFAGHMPESNGLNTFIISTAGEDNPINYASSDLLIKKLKNKGCRVFYNRLIEMPSNFVVKYTEARVSGILDKANEAVPRIARDIMGLTPYAMKKTFVSQILAFAGKVEWYGARIIGKFYYVKSGCIRCGKCAGNCPNKNIALNEKSVAFNWSCGLCMRCVYQCPENAIHIHRPFKFIRFDRWYEQESFRREESRQREAHTV